MRLTIEQTLRGISLADDQKLAALAEAIRKQGWQETREVISLLSSGEKEVADKALVVTLNLGPFALQPMLDSLDPNYPVDCAMNLAQAVDLELEQRHKVAMALDKLLEDKRRVPQPRQAKGVEEKFRARRLCDVAYLQLRRLFSQQESVEDAEINEGMFLDMQESDRDREIAKMRKSKNFTVLLEYFPGEK